jgi:hypothetical protein
MTKKPKYEKPELIDLQETLVAHAVNCSGGANPGTCNTGPVPSGLCKNGSRPSSGGCNSGGVAGGGCNQGFIPHF